MRALENIGLKEVFSSLSAPVKSTLTSVVELARVLSGAGSAGLLIFDGARSLIVGKPIAVDLLASLQTEFNDDGTLRSLPANISAQPVLLGSTAVGSLFAVLEGQPTLSNGRRVVLQTMAAQIGCLLGLARDALSAERDRLRLVQAIQATNGGVWSLDVGRGEFRGDATVAQLIGWPGTTVKADFDAVLDFVHADDRPEFLYAIGRATNLGKPDRHVFRVHASGRWLITAFDRDATDDESVHFIGMLRDHSAQRAVELEVEMHQTQLETLVKDLRKSNRVDVLTGIANRMALNETLRTATMNARARNEWVSLLIIDVDFFKSFNDTFGHVEGDVALRQVANEIARSTRGDDLAARFGGEEFCVLCFAEPELAEKVAERIRSAIEQSSWAKRSVTVSIGVCSLFGSDVDERVLFQQADAALYRAKDTGRNRVVVA
jgi:diguanylate cyclase (GGDEF)-like protein